MRKSRDEAVALLQKWFPQMEGFEGQLKKYKDTIQYLQRENKELAEVAEANKTGTLKHDMELATLKSTIYNLERFRAAVPEDARRVAEASMKRGTKDKSL